MEHPVAIDLVDFLNASPTAFHAVGNNFFNYFLVVDFPVSYRDFVKILRGNRVKLMRHFQNL